MEDSILSLGEQLIAWSGLLLELVAAIPVFWPRAGDGIEEP